MKIIEYSQEPRHVDARKLYGGKLKLTSTGSWVTQFIEMVNSTYMLYLLLSPKAPNFWWAIVVVALAVSFLVQSFIRVNFSFLGRLTNDDKKDSEQRPEIAKSLFYGLVGCIAALSMTFGSAYFLSKSYNHTDKTDITALHFNYNEQFQEISRNFNEKTNSENKNNETVLLSISEKYDNKIKTVKTETDKLYWIRALVDWDSYHQDFIQEHVIEEDKTKRYIHKDLRSARRSIIRALPNMFHFVQQPAIPKTTNGLESFFGHLKDNLRIHRGLTLNHRKNFIKWYLHFRNKAT